MAASAVISSTSSGVSLFERIKAGDNEAFDELYKLHHERVLSAVRRFIQDDGTIDFLVNGVFARVWQVRNTSSAYKGGSSLATWITRIAYNEALMYIRKNQPEKRYIAFSLDAGISSEDEGVVKYDGAGHQHSIDFSVRDLNLDGVVYRRELEMAINTLPASYRAVFKLRLIDGLTTEETCEVLNIGVAAAKARLRRSRLMVQEVLNHRGQKKFKKSVAKIPKAVV